MKKYIFISDIHSNIEVLKKLPEVISEWHDENAVVVFLGDYLDGFFQKDNASLEVLRFIKDLVTSGKAIMLFGNHDLPFYYILKNRSVYSSIDTWKHFGMYETLNSWSISSYDVEFLREILIVRGYQDIVEFIDSIDEPLTFIKLNDNILAAHAGFDMRKSLENQTEHDTTWIRDDYFMSTFSRNNSIHNDFYNKVIVSGHTPNWNLPIEITKGRKTDEVIKHVEDYYSITRYFIDAGSKSSNLQDITNLNILILNEDGSFVKSELLTTDLILKKLKGSEKHD